MATANLILHTGAKSVQREQLLTAHTPLPTRTWRPIPHSTLIDQVENSLKSSGLDIVAESHGMTQDGNRYFGLMQVGGGDGDFGMVVGLRNSHDKKFPAGLVVGASVFVCDNLSFSSEIRLDRRHTVNILRDLPQLVDRAIGQLGDHRRTQEQRFLTYQQHELSNSQANDLMIQALDAQVIPVTKLPDVIKEWRTPRHIDFAKNGHTAWRFFSAVTESIKGNLEQLPKRSCALHGLLDSVCGLATLVQPLKEVVANEPQMALAN